MKRAAMLLAAWAAMQGACAQPAQTGTPSHGAAEAAGPASPVAAQANPAPPQPVKSADCPAAEDTGEAQLLGKWKAQVDGSAPLTLELHRHPQFAETVRGSLDREGRQVELAGDVDDGQLTLEESVNGTNISAHWLGDVVDGSCGREIRGTWQAEGSEREVPFVLRKQP